VCCSVNPQLTKNPIKRNKTNNSFVSRGCVGRNRVQHKVLDLLIPKNQKKIKIFYSRTTGVLWQLSPPDGIAICVCICI